LENYPEDFLLKSVESYLQIAVYISLIKDSDCLWVYILSVMNAEI